VLDADWGSDPAPIHDFDGGTVSRGYIEFATASSGPPQVMPPDRTYQSQKRFGCCRSGITDLFRFDTGPRPTLQVIGWRTEKDGRRYLPLQHDIASVASWPHILPAAPFRDRRSRDFLKII
jgi:hypothetical protein